MTRRRSSLALILVVAATVPASAGAQSGVPGREGDPIVVDGSAVPDLIGEQPQKIVAFSYDDGWNQIPVQVDERKIVDYAAVRQNHQTVDRPYSNLAYADPGTFAGADSDSDLDSNDEIAAMAKDVGARAPASSDPGQVDPASKTELAVTDPLSPSATRYIYLYRTTGNLNPSAGERYVNYDFDLASGDYKTTYDFSGVADDGAGPPVNLENSSVQTDFYSQSLLSRWVTDELAVDAGAASGVDILDGDKVQAFYGCGRSELTFSRGGGGFIANIDGPVRAIRSYIGTNSGTYTQRDHVYYERAEVTDTFLRVHQGLSQLTQFLDYSSAASGMTYKTSADPGGATINGVPDPALETGTTLGPELTWEQSTGPQGTLTILNRVETDIPGVAIGSFYNDDLTPTIPQCGGYADQQAYGASGGAIHNAGKNTDPTLNDGSDPGDPYDLTATRTVYYGAPGGTNSVAEERSDQVDSPLQVEVAGPPGVGLSIEAPASKRLKVGRAARIPVSLTNDGDVTISRAELCGKANRKRVRVGRCVIANNLAAGATTELVVKVELKQTAKRTETLTLRASGDGVAPAFAEVELKRR